MKFNIVIFLFLLTFSISALSSFNTLAIKPGIEGKGSSVSSSYSVFSIYNNPACLVGLRNRYIGISYISYFNFNGNKFSIGYSQPLFKNYSISAAFSLFFIKPAETYSFSGIGNDKINNIEMDGNIAFSGRFLYGIISYGSVIRFTGSIIDKLSAFSVSADLGLKFDVSPANLALALAVRNIPMGKIIYSNKTFKNSFPFDIGAGVTYNIYTWNDISNISFEVNYGIVDGLKFKLSSRIAIKFIGFYLGYITGNIFDIANSYGAGSLYYFVSGLNYGFFINISKIKLDFLNSYNLYMGNTFNISIEIKI